VQLWVLAVSIMIDKVTRYTISCYVSVINDDENDDDDDKLLNCGQCGRFAIAPSAL